MSDFCKQIPKQEYQKCFDILNSGKLKKQEIYRQFLVSVFEVAKKQMDCTDCKLEFAKLEKDSYGKASDIDNVIRLNIATATPKYICQNISTIYHELTHICQHKTTAKKQLGVSKKTNFPFEQSIHPYVLDKDLLGVHPFLVYYCSQTEKQARDVGYGEASAFFEIMDSISKQGSKNKTKKIIQKSQNFFKKKFDYEKLHYEIAFEKVKDFVSQNPNFVGDALDKVFSEFATEAQKTMPYTMDRLELEETVVARIYALTSMGCDDKCKDKIIDFATKKLVLKKHIVMALIYVVDCPYANITKKDFELLFDYAKDSGNFNKDLLVCLQNWDKEDVMALVRDYIAKEKQQQKNRVAEKIDNKEKQKNCESLQEEQQIY